MSSSVRIMALGDSITVGFSDEANGGYRGPLYQMLVNAGDVIDFVGSQQGGAIAAPHHEGHSGQKADWIRDRVYNWLKATPAEFVLLHIGTNNIDQLEKADQITTEIAQILNEIDRYETFSRTTVTVIVARIINRADPRGALGLETTKLNKSIESMAAARIADGDRLLVADFEPALSYPEDIFVSVPPPVHPNASGYAKMAKVWFDALSIALSNKIIPGQGYTLDILTGLAVNQNGILEMTSVVDLEHWKPLVPIGDPVFTPGAPVAMAKQTDGVLTALAVDKYGRLVVASVGGAGIWQPPVGISDAIFNPGTPVAMAKQTDGILSALAIDKGGRLMVASVAGLGLWQRPVGISDSVFIPGSPLAMAKQTDGVLTALAVDKYGRLVVASVPGLGSWQPPIGISDTIFLPGTPVAMAKQTDGVLTALAVDKYGRLVVASVPGLGTWQAPVSISSPIFTRGTAVALAKQIDGVNLSTFIKNQPEFSGSRITQRIGQLTGDGLDPEYRHIPGNVKRVFNSTAAHGVLGVDLGANTEFQGKLVFFFGDVPTFGQANDQADWVAFHSDRVDPWFGFSLSSVDGPDGKFQPFSIKDIGPLGIGQTPTGAFSFPGKDSAGDKEQAYVFAFYFPDDPGQRGSLLVKSSDPTQPVEFDHVFSFSTFNERSGRFFQVAPWVVNNAEFPGLFPSNQGDGLVLMGQGGPANSVHTAWMPLIKGQDPALSAIRYYCGNDCPETWSTREADARALFSTIGYTSLSLAWLPEAKRWLLLYTLASPGAIPLHNDPRSPTQHNPNGPIVARLGTTPWDWSDEIIVFDPLRDNALGKFMHRPGDDLNDVPPVLPPNSDWAYGGETSYAYGPFLLPRFTKWDAAARDLTIYYLLSTFRPYQVQLMCSHFDVPLVNRRRAR